MKVLIDIPSSLVDLVDSLYDAAMIDWGARERSVWRPTPEQEAHAHELGRNSLRAANHYLRQMQEEWNLAQQYAGVARPTRRAIYQEALEIGLQEIRQRRG